MNHISGNLCSAILLLKRLRPCFERLFLLCRYATVLSSMCSNQSISDVPKCSMQIKISSWGISNFRVYFEPEFSFKVLFVTKNIPNKRWILCSLTLDYCSVSCHLNKSADTSSVIIEETGVSLCLIGTLVSLHISGKGVMNGWVEIHLSCRIPV